MRRQHAHKTVQFWLAMAGGWLVLTGFVGFSRQTSPLVHSSTDSERSTRIIVVPSSGSVPTPTIQSLQGADSLQGQGQGGLQQNGAGDFLQPNAKTDSFNTDADAQ